MSHRAIMLALSLFSGAILAQSSPNQALSWSFRSPVTTHASAIIQSNDIVHHLSLRGDSYMNSPFITPSEAYLQQQYPYSFFAVDPTFSDSNPRLHPHPSRLALRLEAGRDTRPLSILSAMACLWNSVLVCYKVCLARLPSPSPVVCMRGCGVLQNSWKNMDQQLCWSSPVL